MPGQKQCVLADATPAARPRSGSPNAPHRHVTTQGADAMVPFGFSARQVLTSDYDGWGRSLKEVMAPQVEEWPDTQLLFNVGPNSMTEQVVAAMGAVASAGVG
jgi:hypothetical protein